MLQNTSYISTTTAKVIYVVLILGLFVPFISIIALIVAYVNQGDGPFWLDENYRYQIRTFWIGILYIFISYLLTFIFIGFITLAATYVWYVVRCAKGLKSLRKHETPDNINSWFI